MSEQNNNNKYTAYNQADTSKGQNTNIQKYDSRLMKDYPFTILLNKVIQNIQDLEVVGLYAYLASLPPEWIINKEHLKSHFKIGTKKIEGLFRKFMNYGLLIKEEYREKGRFVGVNYRLCLEFDRSAENGATVNGATEKTVYIKEIDKKEKEYSAPIKKAHTHSVNNHELIEVFVDEFPDNPHPRDVKTPSKKLTQAINALKKAWPKSISKSGSELTPEGFRSLLVAMKNLNYWLTKPEKKAHMETLIRIDNIEQFLSEKALHDKKGVGRGY
jgi:hypothetical protein